MKEQFFIAGKSITVRHPCKVKRGAGWSRFKMSPSGTLPGITVFCTGCSKLPEQRGRLLGETAEYSVCEKDGFIYKKGRFGVTESTFCVYPLFETGSTEAHVEVFEPKLELALSDGFLWNTLSLNQLLLKENVLLLHAAYIAFRGKAILFSAPSGTGKSTQAALWSKLCGADLINGDKAAVTVENGRAQAYSVPVCGTSGICENASHPLGALVILKRGESNSVKRLTGVSAVAAALPNVHLDFFAPGEQARCVDVLAELFERVPVLELSCTPDEGAVACLLNSLEQNGVF